MRKIVCALMALLLIGVNSYAQKKNGVIYSEHEAIDKTKALWEAFVNADAEKYVSYLADSVFMMSNGNPSKKMAAKEAANGLDWWKNEVEMLKVVDYKPAYPDALEYKGDILWVQDWLLMTGRHIKTGVNIELPIHSMYQFNEDGKIAIMATYFDNDVFEEISESQTTRTNGKVYINHPYILTVRKLMNAYTDRDLETWKSFFTEKAVFMNSMMEYGKSMSLEESARIHEKRLSNKEYKFKVEQVGYPDCIYYEKANNYIVYSWWKTTIMKNGKVYAYPIMLQHSFNDEGKITSEFVYGSSNHMK